MYVKDGEIEREYTPAEFDSLSDGTRKEMGLRPFSLSKLKPANQYQDRQESLAGSGQCNHMAVYRPQR